MTPTPHLCNHDCGNCEAIENPQVALLLNFLVLRFGDEVVQIVNKFCPNLTCCPICHIDDFCHESPDAKSGIICIDALGTDNETCEVATEALKVYEAIKKEKVECESKG